MKCFIDNICYNLPRKRKFIDTKGGNIMEHIKVKAIDYLVTHNLGEMPKNMLKLNRYNLGFSILTYSEGVDIITANGWEYYAENYDGFTVCLPTGQRLIFYNEKLPFSKKHFVIAHEVGHNVLGHTVYGQILGKSKNEADKADESMQEKEADAFALAFLAPPAVLLELKCYSPQEISRVTGLPSGISKKVVLEVIKEQSMKKTNLHFRLINVFRESIEKYRYIQEEKNPNFSENKQNPIPIIINMPNEKNKKSKLNKWAVISIVSSCIVVAFTILIASHNIKLTLNYANTTYTLENNTQQSTNADTIVYVSSTKKYHLENCRFSKSGIPISLSEAIKNNYDPCKFCNPNKQ